MTLTASGLMVLDTKNSANQASYDKSTRLDAAVKQTCSTISQCNDSSDLEAFHVGFAN